MVLVFIGVSGTGSNAAVKKIRPDQLKPYEPDALYSMGPSYVRSGEGAGSVVWFHAAVKLPKGKVVKKLTYYYSGSTASDEAAVTLYRYSMGENEPEPITGAATGGVSAVRPVVNTVPINHAKIKSGYTYFLKVGLVNLGNIKGIKITYN